MADKYRKELSNLSKTYQWSLTASIESVRSFTEATRTLPLFTVGSGGALTAAHMAALLHQSVGTMAKAVTPLEFTTLSKLIPNHSVLIFSAGGRNSDILAAFRQAAVSESRQVLALCMRTNSPLTTLSSKFRYAQLLEFDLPCGKDGFLATNSLLAFVTILTRAYSKSWVSADCDLPETLSSSEIIYGELTTPAQALLEKQTLVVLFGGWGLPAAVDTESKFVEAGLKNIQMADYRNFAHGRHHWLAKHKDETGVVALITPDEKELAKKTIQLLPDDIPVLQIETSKRGPVGGLDLLVKVLHLVYLAGDVQGIDPGKPGVPAFGRRIYHLRNPSYNPKADTLAGISPKEKMAIIRKSKLSFAEMSAEDIEYWRMAYREYLQRIRRASFGAIVFDYDGTLCDPMERYDGLHPEISELLTRLLRAGICIGVATGRGKSVRVACQQALPEEYWTQVLVGYYNGADIGTLADTNQPDKVSPLNITLQRLKQLLDNHKQFNRVARYECRPKQISVEPVSLAWWKIAHSILLDIVNKTDAPGIQIVESSHSIDVIAPGVSKRNLVDTCTQAAKQGGMALNVLCIGDRGEWPGNDYSLLSTPYSLSVDTVSPDPASCWNLSESGHRSIQATLEYLKCMDVSKGTLRLKLKG